MQLVLFKEDENNVEVDDYINIWYQSDNEDPKNPDLYCVVTFVDNDEQLLHFIVINGAWDGTLHRIKNLIHVKKTKKYFRASKVEYKKAPPCADNNDDIPF